MKIQSKNKQSSFTRKLTSDWYKNKSHNITCPNKQCVKILSICNKQLLKIFEENLFENIDLFTLNCQTYQNIFNCFFSEIHPRLLCRVEGREGKEVSVENWKEFSRFLTTVLNLRNWRKKVISRENKFTKFSGEIFKTATDSFLASQFNFSMRR